MNIAFFGTSDRSIQLLEALKNSEFNLVLCITKEDRIVGRKKEVQPTAVKTWAIDNRVQFVTLNSLKAESTSQITSLINNLNIELGVVADFSFIIPEEIFNLPKHKIVNIHFSLLPRYRGAAPVQFSILNRDKKTGISYQIIVKKMDAGPIIHQSEYKLEGTETTQSLYSTLFEKAAVELPEVLTKYVSGEYKPKEQDHSSATFTKSPSHPKNTFIFKEDAKIDWNNSAAEIDSMARAFNPWPIAWTTLGEFSEGFRTVKSEKIKNEKLRNLRVKIHETTLIEAEIRSKQVLEIKKIQVEGKEILNWNEFENGYLA